MIVIDLGCLPPRELSPNACRYQHWSVAHEARQRWKTLVFYAALEARPVNYLNLRMPFHKARLTWTFIYRLNRKRDADNLIAACKVAQDALVQAGIIEADDTEHLELASPVIIVDKSRLSEAIIKIEEL